MEEAASRARSAGMDSGLINAGGNVCCIGAPKDSRHQFGIGIQNPDQTVEDPLFDTIRVSDISVVTSGDYQRYYVVDGVRYHHILDPTTAMPAGRYRSVTVLHSDSSIADMLSTALFILPYEEGLALAQSFDAEALWILPDLTCEATDGYQSLSQKLAS